MKSLFWITVSSLCYAAGIIQSNRLEFDGLKHTDPPCEMCRRNPWEARRVAALRKS